MLKIVLDTNVLVSAIISKGKPFELAQLGFKGKFMIITSEPALNELFDVLERSKFQPVREEVEIVIRAMNFLSNPYRSSRNLTVTPPSPSFLTTDISW